MFKFSNTSKEKLSTCHPELQRLMNEVIKHYDCSIICGHRGEKEQNEAFDKGYSKLRYPDGNHNKIPSLAVDVLPYPFKGYENRDQFVFMQGLIKGISTQLGIPIRLGIDFNGDLSFNNDSLFDGPHIELSKDFKEQSSSNKGEIMDQAKAWEVLKPGVKQLLSDILEQVLKPALEEAVAKSDSKIDDALLAVLEAPLMAALKEQLGHI